jgi:hypothetical protein
MMSIEAIYRQWLREQSDHTLDRECHDAELAIEDEQKPGRADSARLARNLVLQEMNRRMANRA